MNPPLSDAPVVKVAEFVRLPEWVRIEIALQMEDLWSPWLRPDRNPMPRLVIWPRWDRAVALLAEARHRIDTALDVLRNGTDHEGEEW